MTGFGQLKPRNSEEVIFSDMNFFCQYFFSAPYAKVYRINVIVRELMTCISDRVVNICPLVQLREGGKGGIPSPPPQLNKFFF